MYREIWVYMFFYLFHSSFINLVHISEALPLDTPSSNTSLGARTRFTCDSDRFGHDPDLVDCRDALSSIPVIRSKVTFMDRELIPEDPSQVAPNIMPLPFRMMGGKPCSSTPVHYGCC